MKKLFNYSLIIFILFMLFSFTKVNAATFLDGTSYYDDLPSSGGSWTRKYYPATDCTEKNYCTFIVGANVNFTVDYVSFQARFKNEFVTQSTNAFQFDYSAHFWWSRPILTPGFNISNSHVQIDVNGFSYQCSTNYSSTTELQTDIFGTCYFTSQVFRVPSKDFVFNWSSNNFDNLPNDYPLLVFKPNSGISVQLQSLNISNVSYNANDVQIGLDEINSKIDETNGKLQTIIEVQESTKQEMTEINNNMKDINNSITDDSDVEVDKSFFDDFDTSSSPVSDLVTMPITLLQAYYTGLNDSCSPINLGSLYGSELIIPCINLESILGTFLWRVIDAVFSLFLAYNIGQFCVLIYEKMSTLKDTFSGLYGG